MSVWNTGINDLMAAQKLTVISTNQSGNNPGHNSAENSADKNQPSANHIPANSVETDQPTIINQKIQVEQESIHLIELIKRLQQIDYEMLNQKDSRFEQFVAPSHPALIPNPPSNENIIFHQETVEMEAIFSSSPRVEGLMLHPKNQAESDRYLFVFSNGDGLIILDKWSKHSTRIWGEPQSGLDLIDETHDENLRGLESAYAQTTFMLMDGARVTFNSGDTGVIDAIDIIQGNQHIHAISQVSSNGPALNLFSGQVLSDGITADGEIPRGGTVYAGGDGNDWYTASGRLVWGHTRASIVNTPPSHKLEFMRNQSAVENLSIHRVEKSI